MSEGKFYTPSEVRPLYGEIIPTYQSAFAGDPWYEVSKCVDEEQRCAGGFSPCALGSICGTCGLSPSEQAYEADELEDRFEAIAEERDVVWYVEDSEAGITLAAYAWKTSPSDVAIERYADVPAMGEWISEKTKDPNIVWVDEVFANREIKSKGNLRNFGAFVTGMTVRLEADTVAYRTIAPQMTRVAIRDFGENATVFERNIDVPDRRDFVLINAGDEA